MQRLLTWSLALCLLASPAALAGTGPGDTTPGTTKDAKTAAPATTTAVKPGEAPKATANTPPESRSSIDAELQQMRALMEAQAKQLAEQQAALEEQQKEMEALRSQLHGVAASSSNAVAMSNGGTAAAASTVASENTTLAPNTTATPPSGQYTDDTEKKSPLSFKIGEAQFTPGGFLDFTTFFRTTNVGSGIGTNFSGIPYNNAVPAGGLTETGFSAQNSRISLKVDSTFAGAKITGYTEADFLGNAPTNLEVTSNSNTFRMRLYFVDARWSKWEILGGQEWSMLTPNRKGIGFMPSDIFYTQDMDTNYQVGLIWSRDAQFRLIYHPTDSWAMGISVENPQQYTGGAVTFPSLFNSAQVNTGANGTSTPNLVPDIIAKIAHDHDFHGKNWHVEVAGVLSTMKIYTPASVTTTAASTSSKEAGGVSANLNLELFRNFHLIANTFWSDGDGRYIFGLGPNFVVDQNTVTSPFIPSLVHAGSGVGGFEWQVHNSLLYGYYGGAYYGRDYSLDPNKGTLVGYGYNGSSNSNNRAIQEGTFGVLQTFWKSPMYGALQLITQVSYLTRAPWFLATGSPKNAHLTMAYVDLRYVLP